MAARSLGTLTLDIVAKIGGLVSGMNQAERATADSVKRMEASNKRLQASAFAVGSAIGQFLHDGIVRVAEALPAVINSMDDLSKMAQKIGVGTEELSKFAYAAELADVPLETLQTDLSKLIKYQSAAAQGNKEAAEAFDAFGIAVRDSSGHLRSTQDVLGDFADVFKNLPDGPEKTALALRVFGKSGAELIPFLNEGKDGLKDLGDEASRFGQVVSTEAGKNAEEFNDNLSRLKLQVEGLAIQVASDLLPDLIDLVDQFQDLISDGGDVATTAHTIAEAFRAVADVVAIVVNLCQAQGKALAGVGLAAGSLLDLAQRDGEGFAKALKDSAAAFAGAKGDLDQAWARLNGTDGNPGGKQKIGKDFRNVISLVETQAEMAKRLKDEAAARKLLATPDPDKPTNTKAKTGKSDEERQAEQLEEAYKRVIAQQKEQEFLLQDTGKAAQERYDTEFGALAALDPLKKQEIVQGALRNEQLKEEKDLLDQKNEKALQQAKDLEDLLADLQFESDLIGKTNAQRTAEIELRRLGIDATTAQGKATRDQIEAMVREGEERQKQIDAMDDLRSGFEDTFASILDGSKSAKDAFKDLANSIIADIARVAAKKLVEGLFGQYGTAAGGAVGGGWGGLISSIGGALSARAGGGPVSAGVPYLVGEREPELFVPRTAGVILNGKQMAGMNKGSSMNVTNNFVIKGNEKRSQAQMEQDAGRGVQRIATRLGLGTY